MKKSSQIVLLSSLVVLSLTGCPRKQNSIPKTASADVKISYVETYQDSYIKDNIQKPTIPKITAPDGSQFAYVESYKMN